MNPKPIFGGDANLLLDDLIYSRGELGNGSARLVNPLGKHHAPARWTDCVSPSSNNRRSGALREQSRQRRSGRQSSEERRPQSVVASVLVGQNAHATAGAQQFDHRLKSDLTIEQFQSSLAARPTHMLVNETIATFLINARISHEPNKVRHPFPQ